MPCVSCGKSLPSARVPAPDILDSERQQRASKVLATGQGPGFPLWKPWALDLADDVNMLLDDKRELRELLTAAEDWLAQLERRLEQVEKGRTDG